jgi:hypothetical protein
MRYDGVNKSAIIGALSGPVKGNVASRDCASVR